MSNDDDASKLSGTPNNNFTFALGSHVASLLVARRNELLRFKSATRASKTFPCGPAHQSAIGVSGAQKIAKLAESLALLLSQSTGSASPSTIPAKWKFSVRMTDRKSNDTWHHRTETSSVAATHFQNYFVLTLFQRFFFVVVRFLSVLDGFNESQFVMQLE